MKASNRIATGEIAALTGGKLIGDSGIMIRGANTLENAGEGDISFLSNPKYKKWLTGTKASCVFVHESFEMDMHTALIKVADPDIAFSKVIKKLYGEKTHPVEKISPQADIDDKAVVGHGVRIGNWTKIEAGVSIGAGTVIYHNVYIGNNSSIGKNCVIYPSVTILDSVKIGDNVTIHPGTVIGSDGFGYVTSGGKHDKIPQIGGVLIEDNVEIGANVCIDRGTPGDTVISEGAKIDNLVQIAHNVKIGRNCFIISQVGIAGSTIVEDNAVLAGQAGVVGHITIGAGAKVGAQAGVTHDIKPGQLVSGYPAMEHKKAIKLNALTRKLPALFKEIERLKKIIGRSDE
ncbi:MAG: UDP-3-O-(3-hydroxymyristoyl)glucosamine N-acyltransferase [Elusimicrobiota bacterium]